MEVFLNNVHETKSEAEVKIGLHFYPHAHVIHPCTEHLTAEQSVSAYY